MEGAPLRYLIRSWVLHDPHMTLTLIQISQSLLFLLLNNTPNLARTPLTAQNRGLGDFSGSDHCHKTSLLQKWVQLPDLLVAKPRQLTVIHSPGQSQPSLKKLGTQYGGHRECFCKWLQQGEKSLLPMRKENIKCCRLSASPPPESQLETQNFRRTTDLLNQSRHFNKPHPVIHIPCSGGRASRHS